MTKKITKIEVIREVEKEVVVKKKVKEKTSVGILELTESDIDSLKDIHLVKAVAIGFKTLYEQAMDANRDLLEEAKAIVQQSQEPSLTTAATTVIDASIHEDKATGSGYSGHSIGAKVGKTSKYHYVFWDSHARKWKTNFEAKGYDDEIQCALQADRWLEENDDGKDRPRNAIEFKEVADAVEQ